MKTQRYAFVDWYGYPHGLQNTNDLEEAIQTAIEFQCEVIDTQTPIGNQIVFSVWEGWNSDWDFYREDESKRIMKNVK